MPSISNEDMVRTLCITVKSKSETVFFTICKDGGLRFSKKRVWVEIGDVNMRQYLSHA